MTDYRGEKTLDAIASTLLTETQLVYAPKKPRYANLGPIIADLAAHPTLEALLHILNHDLPSAHFLVRHMQAPPAVEGMLLHGILHRAEGDFANAQAWMSDVQDACDGFQPKKKNQGTRLDSGVATQVRGGAWTDQCLVSFVYGSEEPGQLIGEVARFREKGQSQRTEGEEKKALEQRIRAEGRRVLAWCRRKFGDGAVVEASAAWVRHSEEIGRINGAMVSGGEGYREF